MSLNVSPDFIHIFNVSPNHFAELPMSRICAKVNFMRNIVSTCVVDTSNVRCENGEHIKDVESVFPLAVAVKISWWHYF